MLLNLYEIYSSRKTVIVNVQKTYPGMYCDVL